jgi:hypothetical protein
MSIFDDHGSRLRQGLNTVKSLILIQLTQFRCKSSIIQETGHAVGMPNSRSIHVNASRCTVSLRYLPPVKRISRLHGQINWPERDRVAVKELTERQRPESIYSCRHAIICIRQSADFQGVLKDDVLICWSKRIR